MTDAELTGCFERIDQRFEAIVRHLDAHDQRFERMEATIREEGAATRRHFDVVDGRTNHERRLRKLEKPSPR